MENNEELHNPINFVAFLYMGAVIVYDLSA